MLSEDAFNKLYDIAIAIILYLSISHEHNITTEIKGLLVEGLKELARERKK